MIKSENIEKIYEFVKRIDGVELTNAFAVYEGYKEDYEMIYGQSKKGKFQLYDYDNGDFVFCVEYPDREHTHWHPFEIEDAVVEVEKFMGYSIFDNLECVYYTEKFIFPNKEPGFNPVEDSKVFVLSENKPEIYSDNFWNLRILKNCKNLICHGNHVNGKNYYFLTIVEEFDAFVKQVFDAAKSTSEPIFLFYDDLTAYNKVKTALTKLKEGTSK